LHPAQVLRAIKEQVRADDSVTPLHYCGPLNSEHRCTNGVLEEFLWHGEPDGHRTRGVI